MDYNEIKQLIDDNIKPNTNQDITAIVANLVMTGMIDYTRDSIIDIVNQGFGAGAFTWLDVEHGAVIPYPQMSAGRARVVRIFKDNVEYEDGEATIGGVNGITIKRHALVICLEATNEMANDGMQETVGDRFAVINVDGSGGDSSTSFIDLTDTPSDYSGQIGKTLVVNKAENGLEFEEFPPVPIKSIKFNGNTQAPDENGEVDINISGDTVIQDNLNSTASNEALSANQGRVLNEKFSLMPVIHVSKLNTLSDVIAEVPNENRALNMEVHFFNSEGIYKKYLYIPTDLLDRMFLLPTSWLDMDAKRFDHRVKWFKKSPCDFSMVTWNKTINTSGVIVDSGDANSGVTDFIEITEITAIATSWLFRAISYDEDFEPIDSHIMYSGITFDPSSVKYVRLQVSKTVMPSWKVGFNKASSGVPTNFQPYVEVDNSEWESLVDWSKISIGAGDLEIPLDPTGVVTTKAKWLSDFITIKRGETITMIPKTGKSAVGIFQVATYNEHFEYINNLSTSNGKIVINTVGAKYIRIHQGSVNPDINNIYVRGNVKKSIEKGFRLGGKRWLIVGDSISTEDEYYAAVGYGKIVGYINNTVNNNIAVSGHQSSATLSKINDVDCSAYDFATLLIGINDFNYNIPISTFKANLQSIIDKMRADNPSIKIGLFTLLKHGGSQTNSLELTSLEYSEAIREIALDNSIPILDLAKECQLDPSNPAMLANYYVEGDGLHPNDLGHELFIAPLVNEFVKKLV